MPGKVAIYVHVANKCWWTNQCACVEPGCSEWRRRSTPPGGPQPPTDSKAHVPTHILPVLLVEIHPRMSEMGVGGCVRTKVI